MKKNNFGLKDLLKKIDKKIYTIVVGKPIIPPSYDIKRQTIEKYAKEFSTKVFIETGTYLGETVDSLKNKFYKIISIELDNTLFEKAKEKFKEYSHIDIIYGDSSKIFPEILPKINEPILFWLDGHYSGVGTAKGETNTPILEELDPILKHNLKNHVVLIDDARCFIGENGYPTLNQLQKFIDKYNHNLNFYVENDIIRLTPNIETNSNKLIYRDTFRQRIGHYYRYFRYISKHIK